MDSTANWVGALARSNIDVRASQSLLRYSQSDNGWSDSAARRGAAREHEGSPRAHTYAALRRRRGGNPRAHIRGVTAMRRHRPTTARDRRDGPRHSAPARAPMRMHAAERGPMRPWMRPSFIPRAPPRARAHAARGSSSMLPPDMYGSKVQSGPTARRCTAVDRDIRLMRYMYYDTAVVVRELVIDGHVPSHENLGS